MHDPTAVARSAGLVIATSALVVLAGHHLPTGPARAQRVPTQSLRADDTTAQRSIRPS